MLSLDEKLSKISTGKSALFDESDEHELSEDYAPLEELERPEEIERTDIKVSRVRKVPSVGNNHYYDFFNSEEMAEMVEQRRQEAIENGELRMKRNVNRKRNHKYSVYCTDEEFQRIRERAVKAGYPDDVSTFLRKMAVDGMILDIDYSSLNKFTFQLKKIGLNINQIAHACMKYEAGPTDAQFAELKKCEEDIKAVIKQCREINHWAETHPHVLMKEAERRRSANND